jgi:hypothetical protein
MGYVKIPSGSGNTSGRKQHLAMLPSVAFSTSIASSMDIGSGNKKSRDMWASVQPIFSAKSCCDPTMRIAVRRQLFHIGNLPALIVDHANPGDKTSRMTSKTNGAGRNHSLPISTTRWSQSKCCSHVSFALVPLMAPRTTNVFDILYCSHPHRLTTDLLVNPILIGPLPFLSWTWIK